MSRLSAPKQFSAYLVTWSEVDSMPVGGVIIDKGNRLDADWNFIEFATGIETGAVGRRLSRLCVECRIDHKRVGILGHDGPCGSDEVVTEAQQVLKDAKKRIEAQR